MKRHLTFANVMVVILTFIVLGGGAYAMTKLPKNSVGAKQLKKNAVTGVKVADGSLSAADIGGSVKSAITATSADRALQADRATQADRAVVATTPPRPAAWTASTRAAFSRPRQGRKNQWPPQALSTTSRPM